MNLASLTTTDLKHIAELLERRESLLAETAKVEQELTAFESGRRGSRKRAAIPKARGKRARRSKRGKLKETIIGVLQSAGKAGATVKEIAQQAGLKPQSVYMWFYTTGKAVKEIKKAGKAKYRWEG